MTDLNLGVLPCTVRTERERWIEFLIVGDSPMVIGGFLRMARRAVFEHGPHFRQRYCP